MTHGHLTALAIALAMGVAAPAVAAPEGVGFAVPASVQQRLGLAVTRLETKRRSTMIDAFAKVLDPGPLAQLDSDLRAAEAAAQASRAEADRSRALNKAGGSIADKDAEAAVSQAGQDAAHLLILKERLGLEWGPGVARMSEAQRARLIQALSAGRTALVHVDTHNNMGQAGARNVSVDVGDGSLKGVVLGPARQAEPRLQSSGLIVAVSGPQAVLLSIGLTQSAHIETTQQQSGVLIPRSAMVRYQGLDWVYVQTGPDRFVRRLVSNPVAEDDGFFVAQGFATGDEVVSQGALGLFTDEQSQPMKAD